MGEIAQRISSQGFHDDVSEKAIFRKLPTAKNLRSLISEGP